MKKVLCVLFPYLGAVLGSDPALAVDIADVPCQDLRIKGDEKQRYFLIGPTRGEKAPRGGFGLLLVLPGGDGSADFNPFIKRIYKHAVPKTYLVAQAVSMKWTPQQGIIWPTARSRVKGQKFSTEAFVEAIIRDVAKKYKLSRKRIFTLSWSSSGPAAYFISMDKKKLVSGSFIAMSVFKPERLPALKAARGHAYYLYHSPEDRVCPMWMAEKAEKVLKESGARVKLVTYDGGHGWRGDIYGNIRRGIQWFEGKGENP